MTSLDITLIYLTLIYALLTCLIRYYSSMQHLLVPFPSNHLTALPKFGVPFLFLKFDHLNNRANLGTQWIIRIRPKLHRASPESKSVAKHCTIEWRWWVVGVILVYSSGVEPRPCSRCLLRSSQTVQDVCARSLDSSPHGRCSDTDTGPAQPVVQRSVERWYKAELWMCKCLGQNIYRLR